MKEEKFGEFLKQVQYDTVKFKNGSQWLTEVPETPDQLIGDVLDKGDKLAIVGLSKLWKSFFSLQLSVSLTAGRPFLGWSVPHPRSVVHCQFEVRETHFHRRFKSMCRALNVTPTDIGGRLLILNGRGLGIAGEKGIEQIKVSLAEVTGYAPDLIVFDPLYKITTGVENSAEDVKKMLNVFDKLAEELGTAVAYVHHDAKGSPGDRDIRDRGAGSNVLGRDYDACFVLTGHAQNENAVVLETLLRNYAPQEPRTIEFTDHGRGYCFQVNNELAAEKKTSRTKKQQKPLSAYAATAMDILGNDEMDVADFKRDFQGRTGLSDSRVKAFLNWAQAGGNPLFEAREERWHGHYKKYIYCDGGGTLGQLEKLGQKYPP